MTTPITGAISLADVRTELGLSGAISFGTTLVRQLSNQMSGTVTLGNARAAKYVNSTVTNQNALTNFFSSTGVATAFKILIGTSGVIGATSGSTALTLGQFATGSTITINNYGQIGGFGGTGGAPTGGAGGDAIYASYPNQTVVINNQAGAFIRGGGGGGGKGGTGGTGGTGGGGYYTYAEFIGDGAFNAPISCDYSCQFYYSNSYCGGSCDAFPGKYGYVHTCYSCYRTVTVYTSGGGGGAGGSGGNGGRGQGYDGANAGGSTGAGGNAGAFGGTNAGRGGTGGTGGTGGAGGTWGNTGANGNTGSTGATGAAGNNGGGAAGSAGAGGAGGGAAGRYLVKGGNSVTLNNSGTLAGGLA